MATYSLMPRPSYDRRSFDVPSMPSLVDRRKTSMDWDARSKLQPFELGRALGSRMQHSSDSGAWLASGSASRRGKLPPPIQTSRARGTSLQLQRPPCREMRSASSPTLPARSSVDGWRQSKKLLGFFERSRSQRIDSFPQSNPSENVLPPKEQVLQTDSRTPNQLKKKRPTQKIEPVKPLPFAQALVRAAKRITLAVPITESWNPVPSKHKRRKGSVSSEDLGDDSLDESQVPTADTPMFLPTNWTASIFILTTCGVLLQYSAIGLSDRLPERSVRLTSNSAAFASDAIPGRPWVLQVTKSAEDVINQKGSKSRISKKNNRPAKSRTDSILMVMDSAKDLDAWLVAIKSVIISRGARTSQSETNSSEAKEQPDSRLLPGTSHSLRNRTSDALRVVDPAKRSVTTTKNRSYSTTALESPTARAGHRQQDHGRSISLTLPVPGKANVDRMEKLIEHLEPTLVRTELTLPILQWDLPTSFSPTFSSSMSIAKFLVSSDDPNISQEPQASRSYSPGFPNDIAPNFSVPSFSNRFSNSTKSTTSIMTPVGSVASSLGTVSPLRLSQDAKNTQASLLSPHGIASSTYQEHLKQVATTDCTIYDPDWLEAEESMLLPQEEDLMLSTRCSSQLLPEISAEDLKVMVESAKSIETGTVQLSGYHAQQIRLSRDNLLGIRYVQEERQQQQQSEQSGQSEIQEATKLFPLPPTLSRPSSRPMVPIYGTKIRSQSLQPPASGTRLPKKSSVRTLRSGSHAGAMTLRERRSFTAIPIHLLGPPAGPPPTNPLPAIPTQG